MPKSPLRSGANIGATSRNRGESVVHVWRNEFAGAVLLTLMTIVVYWPALSGGFVLDDDVLLTQNRLVKAPNGLQRIWFTTEPIDYWPLTNTSFWLEWRLWGMNSTGYHITNLALHIFDSLLIWLVLRKLAVPGAFLAALLFAIHPVNVESVAWIAQRKNLLAMMFFLISVWCFMLSGLARPQPADGRPEPPTESWYALSLLAFLLALLSKGSVAVLPLVLLIIVLWKCGRIRRADLLRVAPFFLLAMVLIQLNVWFQTHGNSAVVLRHATFLERLLGAGAVVWFYLAKAIVPLDLEFIYPQWEIRTTNLIWWLPLVAAIAVSVLLWRARHQGRGRPLFLAWVYFCIALLPVMGFVDVGYMQYSLVADHYEHLALVGVVALAATGWSYWRRGDCDRSRWANIAAIAMVATLAVLTWQQSHLYASPTVLYESAIKSNRDCWLAYNMLGKLEADAGLSDRAIANYENALHINPKYSDAHYNLAIELAAKGRLSEAIAHYREAIRLGPDSADLHNNYAIALALDERADESLAELQGAFQLEPNHLPTNCNLTSAYARLGRLSDAIAVARHALAVAAADGDVEMIQRINEQLSVLQTMISRPTEGNSSSGSGSARP